jgi:hypothetical protein
MRLLALPLGWQLWGRHRLGLLGGLFAWLLCALGTYLLPETSAIRQQLLMAGSGLALPLSLVFLTAVFAYGFDGIAIEARSSAFPARQLTLPVSTAALLAWPMLSGALAMTLTWIAWGLFVLAPNRVEMPVWWPAVALAAGLAWLQALLWTPFSLPYVRVLMLVLVGGALEGLVIAGVHWEIGEPILAGLFVVLFLAAVFVAYRSLVAFRRGDVPEWSWSFGAVRSSRSGKAPDRPPFLSANSAQFWYERRRHLWAFPFVMALVLLCSTLLNVVLTLSNRDALLDSSSLMLRGPFTRESCLVFMVFGWVVFFAPFFAGPMGNDLGALGTKERAPSFLLARPLTSGDLVAIKLQVGASSVLAGLALVPVAGLTWLVGLGFGPPVAEWWRQVLETYHPIRAWTMVPLAVVGLVGLTWLQFCKGMPLGLLGRVWSYWIIALYLGPITVLALGASWVLSSVESLGQFWSLLPWLSGVLAVAGVLKLLAIAGVLERVCRRRLWPPRVLGTVLGVWLVTVSCLFVLFSWLVPETVMPTYQLVFPIVLATPLTRIAAAPLVLEWVRHR